MKRRRGLLLAASLILMLCAAGGVWLYVQQQQYHRNRQLIAALEHRDSNTAIELVSAGADPNTRQYAPPAPTLKLLLSHLLHHKTAPYVDSVTALMLACGTPTEAPANRRYHRWIAMEENLPLLTMMLAHGANVRAGTQTGNSPIHVATIAGRVKTVELLLNHGANINAQDLLGTTPLMMALSDSTPKMAHWLLSRSANPNVQDINGNTALYYAINSLLAESVISDLLAHGADPNLRDKEGVSPLQMAQEAGDADMVRLLKGKAK